MKYNLLNPLEFPHSLSFAGLTWCDILALALVAALASVTLAAHVSRCQEHSTIFSIGIVSDI